MDRLSILVGRFNKSVAQTKYFFKVQQIGRFIPLVGAIRRSVESPLYLIDDQPEFWSDTTIGCFKILMLTS